jgi:hypothetical protein
MIKSGAFRQFALRDPVSFPEALEQVSEILAHDL